MQIKCTMRYFITSHQSEWPPSKNLQTIDAREGVEKMEHSYIFGGMSVGIATMGNRMEIP